MKVDSLSDRQMELKDKAPRFRVNGEMRKPGISQQAELLVQRLFVWISRLLPIRPVIQLAAKPLMVGTPARGVHPSIGWDGENRFGSKSLPLSQRVQRVRRILRWVFNRAWVVEPVWRKEAW
jgi:hypothetical protein